MKNKTKVKLENELKNCNRILSRAPLDEQALYRKGDVLFELKQYQEALEVYELLIDTVPGKPDLWMKKIRTLIKFKKGIDENKAFDFESELTNYINAKYRPSDPDTEEINEALDVTYNLMINNSIDNVSFFEPRMGSFEGWSKLAKLFSIMGRYDEANKAYKTSHKIYESINKSFREAQRKINAIQNYNNMIYENNEDGDAWYNISHTLEKVGESEKASDACKRAFQLYYKRGNVSIKKHLYEIAYKSFKKALEINPEFERAWVKSGYALIKQSEFKNAINHFDKALEMNQEDAEAWYFRGLAFAKLKLHNDSLNSYERALKIKPQFFEVFYEKGRLYSEIQNYKKSLEFYEEALKLKDKDFMLWNNYSFVLAKSEKYREALKACQKSLEIKPDYYASLYNKAYILEKLGKEEESKFVYLRAAESFYETGDRLYSSSNFRKAVEFYDNVLKIIPDHVGALSKKSSSLFKLGDIRDTRDILRLTDKALEIDPKCAECWFLKGEIYCKRGETEKAREFHEKAIQLNPALSEKMSYLYNYDHKVDKCTQSKKEKNKIENWYEEENYVNKYGLYK